MHTVGDLMTRHPHCCLPGTPLVDVARAMRDGAFGSMLVVADHETRRLVGIVTDRDIVVRAVAFGADVSSATAGDHMTHPVHTLTPDASVEACRSLMESRRVRRVPIIGGGGAVVGIVSLTDFGGDIRRDDLGATLSQIAEHDTRQLYSEVMEGTHSGETVTPVDDPSTSVHIKQ